MGSEPGAVLSAFLIAGSIGAALAVRPTAVHVLIPVPALAYLVAGTIAGLIHDPAARSSHTVLAVSALQWMASGFVGMTIATIIVIAITAFRRIRNRAHAATAVTALDQ
jgi:hypothetical protein